MSDGARPVRFLLVEDEQAHADLISMSLEDNCVVNTIDHVKDGAEALAYLRREGDYADAGRPDVVLLDLNLPRVDGHEVLQEMKADEDLRRIPVVILTTSASDKDLEKAYANYANSFLTKPVDFEKLQEMVKHLKLYWTVWNQAPSSANSRRAA